MDDRVTLMLDGEDPNKPISLQIPKGDFTLYVKKEASRRYLLFLGYAITGKKGHIVLQRGSESLESVKTIAKTPSLV